MLREGSRWYMTWQEDKRTPTSDFPQVDQARLIDDNPRELVPRWLETQGVRLNAAATYVHISEMSLNL